MAKSLQASLVQPRRYGPVYFVVKEDHAHPAWWQSPVWLRTIFPGHIAAKTSEAAGLDLADSGRVKRRYDEVGRPEANVVIQVDDLDGAVIAVLDGDTKAVLFDIPRI